MEIALGLLLVAAIASLIWYSRKHGPKRQRAEAEFPDDIPEMSSTRGKGKRDDPDDRHESDAADGSGGDGGGGGGD